MKTITCSDGSRYVGEWDYGEKQETGRGDVY